MKNDHPKIIEFADTVDDIRSMKRCDAVDDIGYGRHSGGRSSPAHGW